MSELSNWASRLLFPDRNKAEFDKFVQEVRYNHRMLLFAVHVTLRTVNHSSDHSLLLVNCFFMN